MQNKNSNNKDIVIYINDVSYDDLSEQDPDRFETGGPEINDGLENLLASVSSMEKEFMLLLFIGMKSSEIRKLMRLRNFQQYDRLLDRTRKNILTIKKHGFLQYNKNIR